MHQRPKTGDGARRYLQHRGEARTAGGRRRDRGAAVRAGEVGEAHVDAAPRGAIDPIRDLLGQVANEGAIIDRHDQRCLRPPDKSNQRVCHRLRRLAAVLQKGQREIAPAHPLPPVPIALGHSTRVLYPSFRIRLSTPIPVAQDLSPLRSWATGFVREWGARPWESVSLGMATYHSVNT